MADRDKLPYIEYAPAWDMTHPEEYKKLVKNNHKSEVSVADGSKKSNIFSMSTKRVLAQQ